MADITCKYRTSEYTLNTFDDVMKTVDWIRNALRAVFQDFDTLESYCYITFDAGDLSYDCTSIDEFKQYAFGKEINVKTLSVGVSKNWITTLLTVRAHKQDIVAEQEYILSSTDEKLLVDIRNALQTKKKGIPLHSIHTIINCEKHEDNSVHIGNNNQISNSVIGGNNKAEIKQETVVPEHKEESIASKSFWQIIVPILVIVVGAAICVWWGLN